MNNRIVIPLLHVSINIHELQILTCQNSDHFHCSGLSVSLGLYINQWCMFPIVDVLIPIGDPQSATRLSIVDRSTTWATTDNPIPLHSVGVAVFYCKIFQFHCKIFWSFFVGFIRVFANYDQNRVNYDRSGSQCLQMDKVLQGFLRICICYDSVPIALQICSYIQIRK